MRKSKLMEDLTIRGTVFEILKILDGESYAQAKKILDATDWCLQTYSLLDSEAARESEEQ